MSQKFFLNITTSYNNEGDVLINRALIENLSDRGFVYINKNKKPVDFIKKITTGIPNIVLIDNFYYTLISKLTSGNVNLISTPGHSFGSSLDKCISNIISSIFFIVLRLLGAKIIKLGGSSGPFGKLVKISEIIKTKTYNYYGQRDSTSINLLSLDMEKDYFPDLAFISKDILSAKGGEPIRDSKIVISFRPSASDDKINKNYSDLVLNNLRKLISQTDRNELLVCYQVPSDRDFNYGLYEELKKWYKKVEFIETKLELQDALKIYSSASLILSNRLHILLPAMILNVKHIAIIDKKQHNKITAIYEDLGLSELIFDIFSENKKTLINIRSDFSEIAENQKDLAINKINYLIK